MNKFIQIHSSKTANIGKKGDITQHDIAKVSLYC